LRQRLDAPIRDGAFPTWTMRPSAGELMKIPYVGRASISEARLALDWHDLISRDSQRSRL
jgi:hypothetical protein